MSKLKSRLLNALVLSALFAMAAISIAPALADDSAKLPQLTGRARSAKTVGPPVQYLLWKNTSGQYSLWALDASNRYNYFFYGPNANWTVTDFKAGYDGQPRMLWTNTDGQQSLYDINVNTPYNGEFTYDLLGPYPNWTVKSFAPDASGDEQLLWDNTNGEASLWNFTPAISSSTSQSYYSYNLYPAETGYSANQVSIGPNGDPMLLWQRSDNLTSVWTVDPASGQFTFNNYGPYTNRGWYSKYVATGTDNLTRLAWQNTDGSISLWTITNPANGHYTYYNYMPATPVQLKGLSIDGNLNPRLFFVTSTGAAQLWTINPAGGHYNYIQFGPYPNYTPVFYASIYATPAM